MSASVDGFYAAYLTGSTGQGLAMLVFRNGAIVGVDVVGVKYDGTYSESCNGVSIKLTVSVPPNTPLIQGVSTGPQGEDSGMELHLPPDFLSLPFIRIDTGHGPVNVKLTKLRKLDD